MAHGKAIGFSKSTRMLQFCAYTFDVSVGEIMTTLCFGGCVCIPAETNGPEGIAPAINSMKVNLALLTPVLLKLFRPEDVPTLKTLVSGGESHSEDCIQIWSKQLKIAYGPTEGKCRSLSPGLFGED
ncbi:hypothetical protein HYFRA_00014073 [Hymenoscyphus fraxineus]|uniref:AMP-dependent synthetase/ligase domain-containing protein n=1 Tax=Hymenoscyphus fraxineus TaxID=746836 RepID=A0A9N9LFF2_9HELO|nr:hypothetical protein HYFRA_00014073 [Hymenoscyphus fraxineus]